MKCKILCLLCFSVASILNAQLTTEKYALINGWYQYALSLQTPGNYRIITSEEIIHMPFVENRPEAVAQFDCLITDCRIGQRSLTWAMDSLIPDTGPASLLPDYLRRWMIYYLYSDQLKLIEKPVKIRYLFGKRDLYICNGSGTSNEGFLELSCLTGVCDGFEYGGPLIISWSATEDTVMDSIRALQMFTVACQEGMIVSMSAEPEWYSPSTMVQCTDSFYDTYPYHLEADVEYNSNFRVEGTTRVTETFNVLFLKKGGYEYLIAFHGAGGCFNVENLTDFLDIL